MKIGSLVRAFGEIGVVLETDGNLEVLVLWGDSSLPKGWVWHGVLEVICE